MPLNKETETHLSLKQQYLNVFFTQISTTSYKCHTILFRKEIAMDWIFLHQRYGFSKVNVWLQVLYIIIGKDSHKILKVLYDTTEMNVTLK